MKLIYIFTILLANMISVQALASDDISDHRKFARAIGAFSLTYRLIEQVNVACDMQLHTGEKEIEERLQQSFGLSLQQAETLFAPSAHSDVMARQLIAKLLGSKDICNHPELILWHHAMLEKLNKHHELILEIKDFEMIRRFIDHNNGS